MTLARDLIEQTIKHNPEQYRTWQDASKYILLTSGNGYFWNDEGYVEYVGDLTPWEAENERQMLLSLPKKISTAMLPHVKERVVRNKRIIKNIDTLLDYTLSLTDKIFVDPDCLLATAPANISEDWADTINQLTKDAELVFEE